MAWNQVTDTAIQNFLKHEGFAEGYRRGEKIDGKIALDFEH